MTKAQLLPFLMGIYFRLFSVMQIVKLCRCENALRRFFSFSADACLNKNSSLTCEMVKARAPAENFSLKLT